MTFRTSYKCYSIAMLPIEKQNSEYGGKIFLPSSALDNMNRMRIAYPMLFKLENKKANTFTHCGVLEFIAEEGRAYIPSWMMNNLLLEEGSSIHIKNVSLPTASFAKFEPQSVDFLDISDPKEALESALRSFASLTVGDMIPIYHQNKLYEMKVLETEPGDAIKIIDCDMSVDFAPPVGYVEPERVPRPICGYDINVKVDVSQFAVKQFQAFGGQGARIDGKSNVTEQVQQEIKRGVPNYGYKKGSLRFLRFMKEAADEQKIEEPAQEGFSAFHGEGQIMKNKKKLEVKKLLN